MLLQLVGKEEGWMNFNTNGEEDDIAIGYVENYLVKP